jgi:hypothetical protein
LEEKKVKQAKNTFFDRERLLKKGVYITSPNIFDLDISARSFKYDIAKAQGPRLFCRREERGE